MKTLKNISFLLAFACAIPAYAIESEAPIADTVKVATNEAEQPTIKTILDSAHNYAVAGATSMYGLAGSAAAFAGTLVATDSLKMAFLAGGGTIALSAIPAIYFYNKYKAQFGEKFKTLQDIARPDMLMYMMPLMIGATAYTWSNIASAGGYCLGAVIGKAAQALGLGLKTAGFAALSTAIAIPSYVEARNQSDEKNPDSAYMTALKCMYASAKNFVCLSFAITAAASAVMYAAQK